MTLAVAYIVIALVVLVFCCLSEGGLGGQETTTYYFRYTKNDEFNARVYLNRIPSDSKYFSLYCKPDCTNIGENIHKCLDSYKSPQTNGTIGENITLTLKLVEDYQIIQCFIYLNDNNGVLCTKKKVLYGIRTFESNVSASSPCLRPHGPCGIYLNFENKCDDKAKALFLNHIKKEDLPEPPQPIETNNVLVAAEGGTVTLHCIFRGNPRPKITWRRGELTIDGSVGRYRQTFDKMLEIVSLYRNDTGVYICVAKNILGVARQKIYLVVNENETNANQDGEDTKMQFTTSNTTTSTAAPMSSTTILVSTTSTTISSTSTQPTMNMYDDSQNLAIIILPVTGVAVVILTVITILVFKKHCCRKFRPAQQPQLPINNDPFYLNLLFRRECDQEIEAAEQHYYEEIK